MDIFDIMSLTSSGIMIIGVIFAVYFTFRKPQDSLEKKQIIAGEELKDKATLLQQKEAENKANVLAEQIKSRNEENERRFSDMGVRLDTAMTTAQNHIHTVDVKVDKLIDTVGAMSNEIVRLGTIINERIPKR